MKINSKCSFASVFNGLRRRQDAFTLVEMMTAVFCLSLLIVAGMTLTTSGSVFFRNTTTNAFAETDVTYAARFVEMKIEEASQFNITAATGLGAGTRMDFNNADGTACSFVLSAVDDSGFSGHRSLIYNGPDAANKVVLKGIPTATMIFSPTTTGLTVTRQSQMDSYRRITVTLPADRQSAGGSGALRVTSQRAVLRVVPRNIYDDINGNS